MAIMRLYSNYNVLILGTFNVLSRYNIILSAAVSFCRFFFIQEWGLSFALTYEKVLIQKQTFFNNTFLLKRIDPYKDVIWT